MIVTILDEGTLESIVAQLARYLECNLYDTTAAFVADSYDCHLAAMYLRVGSGVIELRVVLMCRRFSEWHEHVTC
jgi:hypothetical protein